MIVGKVPGHAEVVEAYLVDHGYHVVTINEAGMAEGWLRERQFNVVVLGIRLPGQTWHESLRAVKTLAPEAAVLMLAESADAEDMRDALSAGTYRALEPTLTADDLMAMITHDRGGVFVVLRG